MALPILSSLRYVLVGGLGGIYILISDFAIAKTSFG